MKTPQEKIRKLIKDYYGKVGRIKFYTEGHKEMMKLFYPLLKTLEQIAFWEEKK